MRPLVWLSLLSMGCLGARPAIGLKASWEDVAKAERQARDAAKVREIGAAVAGVGVGLGLIFVVAAQAQTTNPVIDPVLAQGSDVGNRLRELTAQNARRDNTIGTGLVAGSIGAFLLACAASALVDGGASDWLVAQREQERRELVPDERLANEALLEAVQRAQRLPPEPGQTLRPGMRAVRKRAVKAPLFE